MSKIKINDWPVKKISGAKRANIKCSKVIDDWFFGFGKDSYSQFEGTWWDMICFAINVLASENTKLVASEFYKPEWENKNYIGEDKPYEFDAEGFNEDSMF